MKYYFKENFRFLYADGQLYDESGREAYSYENVTLWLPQINLYRQGEKVGHVKKNFTFLLHQYDIFLQDRLVCTIDQEFTFFKPKLSLAQLGWRVEGDWLALDYRIYGPYDNLICEISQELFHLTRHYCVNIIDESEEALVLLVVLAINQYDKDIANNSGATVHIGGNNN